MSERDYSEHVRLCIYKPMYKWLRVIECSTYVPPYNVMLSILHHWLTVCAVCALPMVKW